jgi:hypothetical protein
MYYPEARLGGRFLGSCPGAYQGRNCNGGNNADYRNYDQ